MFDCDGTRLEAGDKVTFLLGAGVLEGIALRASGKYVTILYEGGEYGISPSRVRRMAPDPETERQR